MTLISKTCKDWEVRYQVEVTLIHLGVRPLLRSIFSVCWVITCSNVRTWISQEGIQVLYSKDKKFHLEIDFMGLNYSRFLARAFWKGIPKY